MKHNHSNHAIRRLEQIQYIILRQTPPSDEGCVAWWRWLLSDPATRTISAFSKSTVRDYLEDGITENTVGD